MAAGYAGLDNPLFLHGQDHDGVRDAKKVVEHVKANRLTKRAKT